MKVLLILLVITFNVQAESSLSKFINNAPLECQKGLKNYEKLSNEILYSQLMLIQLGFMETLFEVRTFIIKDNAISAQKIIDLKINSYLLRQLKSPETKAKRNRKRILAIRDSLVINPLMVSELSNQIINELFIEKGF